jgi:hypothetical protein
MAEDRRIADKEFRQTQDERHRENIDRFKGIETHLTRHDERLEKIDQHVMEDSAKDIELMQLVEQRHEEAKKAVKENTELTLSIKEDTASLVTIWKTWTWFRKFLAWFIPVACTAIGAYVTWTIKK